MAGVGVGAAPAVDRRPLSDGELHYVWWYIQGSVMEPGVRWRLRRAWGMCQRHAWGALAAEAAFRHNYLHGPALLYQDLLDRGVRAFDLKGPWPEQRIARRLRTRAPCLMCDMGLGHSSRSGRDPARFAHGRDLAMVREFAEATREHWRDTVCGTCAGGGATSRCRPHLLEELRDGRARHLALQQALLAEILHRLAAYSRSFRWECRNTETDRDRGALLSAVGWCSGWGSGLALLGERPAEGARDKHG